MKIYLASSWRNILQPAIVHMLRRCGHDVYDFRNPAPDQNGFNWREIDPNWENWTPAEYRDALRHPIALKGYQFDKQALDDCDACVLLLPSGRSASWEFGYACGQGKEAAVIMLEACEPELMYLEASILTSTHQIFDWAVEMGGQIPEGGIPNPEPIRCATFGGADIPPEIRAKMDEDRARAEADQS